MKTFSQTLLFALFSAAFVHAQGIEDTNMIAIGPWSEPAPCVGDIGCGAIRGRLLIYYGFSPRALGRPLDRPETQVYLELQNLSDSSLDIYFDFEKGLRGELKDVHGKPATSSGGPGSGTFPSASWITLPYDATIRLRASWYGYGFPRNSGLMIPFFKKLVIKPGDTTSYLLSATFTVSPPTNHVSSPDRHVWTGKVLLPDMKISAKQPH
jgi:hypothetical protein